MLTEDDKVKCGVRRQFAQCDWAHSITGFPREQLEEMVSGELIVMRQHKVKVGYLR